MMGALPLAARALCAALLLLLGGRASAQGVVQIDAILSMTGPGAFIGHDQQLALLSLEGQVNASGGIRGQYLHFAIRDDATDPQLAVQYANDAVERKASVFLISGFVAACQAVVPLVHSGPVAYCLSPGLYPPANSYVYSAAASTADMLVAACHYFRDRGWTRIALLATADATGADAEAHLAAALALRENKGLALVADQRFAGNDISVAAQLARIRAAQPDVVIGWASGTPFATVLRGLRDASYDVPVMTTTANMTFAQMKRYAPMLPAQLYFPGLSYLAGAAPTQAIGAAEQSFFASMKASQLAPDFVVGMTWDPASILVDALRRLGPDVGADRLRAYLNGLHGYAGIGGTYDFRTGNQRGLDVRDVMVMRWDAGGERWEAVSRLGGAALTR